MLPATRATVIAAAIARAEQLTGPVAVTLAQGRSYQVGRDVQTVPWTARQRDELTAPLRWEFSPQRRARGGLDVDLAPVLEPHYADEGADVDWDAQDRLYAEARALYSATGLAEVERILGTVARESVGAT